MGTGADRLAAALSRLGVTHVFGLPGTQSVPFFDGLRRSPLRTVLTTHELNAAFMAVGFYRASGRPAVLASIPGPGFTHALSGVVEARHDSAALVHVVGPPAAEPPQRFRLQAVEQEAIGRLETKGVFEIRTLPELEQTVHAAWTRATGGEPGPVVLHVPPSILTASGPSSPDSLLPRGAGAPGAAIDRAVARLVDAQRPVLLVGQGASAAADVVLRLAETLGAPVVTSCSGRGIVPEDHRLVLGYDVTRSSTDVLNRVLATADCILVLGYKLTHNGTAGFRMQLPSEVLVHVDADREIPGANYPVAQAVVADVGDVAARCLDRLSIGDHRVEWTAAEIAEWRAKLSALADDDTPEPRIVGASPPTAERFFSLLRQALPRETIVVTDSGLHQVLVRRHYRVLATRGLMVPSDYQSMGFGIPAAIGAKLAAPDRPVVAIVGDGGFAMSGMELLTAVRERVPLTVIVFNDGYLNLIRMQQFGASGRSNAVRLANPDFELMAIAVGAEYRLFEGADSLRDLPRREREGVTLLEVRLGDSGSMMRQRFDGLVRAGARRTLGPRLLQTVKQWLRGR